MNTLEALLDPRARLDLGNPGDCLTSLRCITWQPGGYRGEVRVGGTRLGVQRILSGRLELSGEVSPTEGEGAAAPREPGTWLQSAHGQPGNVRWARSPRGALLVRADVPVCAIDPERTTVALREARHGLARLLGERPVRHARQAISPEQAAEVVADLRWDDDRVVSLEQDGAWELRPRLLGSVVPVQVRVGEHDLHLSHRLLRQLPAGDRGHALEDHALRQNLRLRGCRLVREPDAGVLVETQLDARLVDAAQLAVAVRAVAAGARHVRGALRLFVENASLARSYVRLFCR